METKREGYEELDALRTVEVSVFEAIKAMKENMIVRYDWRYFTIDADGEITMYTPKYTADSGPAWISGEHDLGKILNQDKVSVLVPPGYTDKEVVEKLNEVSDEGVEEFIRENGYAKKQTYVKDD